MRLLPILFALLALAASAPGASAQDAGRMISERVRFDPGTSGTVIRGGLAGSPTHRYLINVRRGQRLVLELENADSPGWAVFQVYAPGRPIQARYAAPNADGLRFDLLGWRGRVSHSGDYQIVVYPGGKSEEANYELYISVE